MSVYVAFGTYCKAAIAGQPLHCSVLLACAMPTFDYDDVVRERGRLKGKQQLACMSFLDIQRLLQLHMTILVFRNDKRQRLIDCVL